MTMDLEAANGCATPMNTKEGWSIVEKNIPLNGEENKTYQTAIGSLMYLMLGMRPDLAFAIHKVAQYASKVAETLERSETNLEIC